MTTEELAIQMNKQFEAMNKRLDSVDKRLDAIEENTEITREATNSIIEWIDYYFADDKPFPVDTDEAC